MINKSQIMTWRNIGYDAQELICRCDSDESVEKLAEMAEAIKEKMNRLDISELKQLHTEKNIAFTEYADMISETLDKEPVDIARTRNCANALLKIVVDMRYGSLKDDEFYPNFKISQQNDNCTISGPIKLDHIYRDVRMTGLFELEINVSVDFPNTLPVVRELTEKIDRNYPHLYTNGQFCLASNLELKIYFLKNKNIATFVDDYIIPYLYTYCYYEKYGVYPYGERSHGIMGDLEYLKELLNVDDWGQLFKIITFISTSKYRGHIPCPCQSGGKLRNCHGEVIKEIINSGIVDDIKKILKDIEEEVKKENGKYN